MGAAAAALDRRSAAWSWRLQPTRAQTSTPARADRGHSKADSRRRLPRPPAAKGKVPDGAKGDEISRRGQGSDRKRPRVTGPGAIEACPPTPLGTDERPGVAEEMQVVQHDDDHHQCTSQ